MWQDNKSTIDIVNGHRNFQSSKQINPKFHYTGEMVDNKELYLKYKPSEEMIADVLYQLEAILCYLKGYLIPN